MINDNKSKPSKLSIKFYLKTDIDGKYYDDEVYGEEYFMCYPIYIMITYKRKHYHICSRFLSFIDQDDFDKDNFFEFEFLKKNYFNPYGVRESDVVKIVLEKINTENKLTSSTNKYDLLNYLILEKQFIQSLFERFSETGFSRINKFSSYYNFYFKFVFVEFESLLKRLCNSKFNEIFKSNLDLAQNIPWDKYFGNLLAFSNTIIIYQSDIEKSEIVESLKDLNRIRTWLKETLVFKYGFGHKGVTKLNWMNTEFQLEFYSELANSGMSSHLIEMLHEIIEIVEMTNDFFQEYHPFNSAE